MKPYWENLTEFSCAGDSE